MIFSVRPPLPVFELPPQFLRSSDAPAFILDEFDNNFTNFFVIIHYQIAVHKNYHHTKKWLLRSGFTNEWVYLYKDLTSYSEKMPRG